MPVRIPLETRLPFRSSRATPFQDRIWLPAAVFMLEAYSGSNFPFDVPCPPVFTAGFFCPNQSFGTSSKFAMIRAAIGLGRKVGRRQRHELTTYLPLSPNDQDQVNQNKAAGLSSKRIQSL
jgi:hypothetical protein